MRGRSIFGQWLPRVIIVLVGFGVRTVGLGAESLWYDETVSAFLARQDIPALIAHTARDIHPPGYYLLLHLWARLAGDSEFALAFMSLVWGVLLCALAYRVAHNLLGRQAAFWALLIVAVSPYNVWYSQEVRMYTLAAVLGLLVVWWSARLEAGDPLSGAGYVLCSAAGLYVLYYFAFLLLALNGLMLWILIRRQAWSAMSSWLLTQVAVLLLYAPWLPVAWRQVVDPPVPPWRSAVPLLDAVVETSAALSSGQAVRPAQAWPLILAAGVLFIGGVLGAWIRGSRINVRRQAARRDSDRLGVVASLPGPTAALLLVSATFGPLALIGAVSLVTPLYHVRYVFTYSPAFYLILGAGVAWLMRLARPLAWLFLVCIVAGGAYGVYALHTNPESATDDLRGAVHYLADRWRPGDAVLVNAGYAYTAFLYYYEGPLAGRLRLTDYETPAGDPGAPLLLQAGILGGSPDLGWGDARSDFYATTDAETTESLTRVLEDHPRLWVLRIYDTVADPDSVVREWLARETTPFDDRTFAGPAYTHVQGYMARRQPAPPVAEAVALTDGVSLVGSRMPTTAVAGRPLDVVLWWQITGQQPALSSPHAVSLKLWGTESARMAPSLAAQSDEWPVGSLLMTPSWPSDAVIRHPMRLRLHPDTVAGRYRLEVQMYDPITQRPLDRLDGTGNTIVLGELSVITADAVPE